MNIKFDFLGLAELKRSLDDLHAKVDIILSRKEYVTPELEDVIKKVAARSIYIDKQVP